MPTVTFTRTNTPSVNGYVTIDVQVNYSETYNQSTNKTLVKITSVKIRNRSYSVGSNIIKGSVKINGTVVASFSPGESASAQSNISTSYSTITGGTLGSKEVAHNADGSGSFTMTLDEAVNATAYFSGFFGYHDASYKVGPATPINKTVDLTTRPRITPVSAADAYFGDPVSITLAPYNNSFVHTVKATCAGRTEAIGAAKTSATTLTWTPSVANFAPLITNAMAAAAVITCETYNGDSLIGQSSTTITLSFKAASVAPSVSIATADPTGNLTTYGKYVKSKSKITVTLTPTLAYGATVSIIGITANGANYNSSPATTDFIASASNTTVSATITDSRGQQASDSVPIQIYDYDPPQILMFEAHRCDANGVLKNDGGYFRVDYSIVMSPLGNQNTLTDALTIKYKKRSASSYSQTKFTPSAYTETGSTGAIQVDTNSTYDVVVELKDDFSTATGELVLPTASTRMNWGPGENGGVAIGKVSEQNKTLEIADGWSVDFIGSSAASARKSIKGCLTPTAAFAIPAPGNSVSYDMDGLTADYELTRWNFSASAENKPPADLYWATAAGYFTITNNGGTTSETMRPVFEDPTAVAITNH